jgi:hypothetical protein
LGPMHPREDGGPVEETITYFEIPGRRNTEETLRLAAERAKRLGISKIVLASTTGEVARLAAKRYAGSGLQLIVVPHQFGFWMAQRFPPELVRELEAEGHRVHFGTMLFHTDGFYGVGAPEAMAMILRTVCQGLKVCVETILMAGDAGLVEEGEQVIAVSGTARGADTAVVALASNSQKLHELHITQVICKPLKNRSWPRSSSPYDLPGGKKGLPELRDEDL